MGEPSAPTAIADRYRAALATAGVDLEQVGYLTSGPLGWTPADADHRVVAWNRRRTLARRRLDDLERSIDAARAALRLEREAAA